MEQAIEGGARMKSTKKTFITGLSYTFFANIFSTFVSSLFILIIPKLIGVAEYGYWQLFVFYSGYIAYMSLGITDGIYLRYGGLEYEDLPRKKLIAQYWSLAAFEVLVSIGAYLAIYPRITDADRAFILLFVCMVALLTVPKSLLTFCMQATNRIKDNALTIIIEKAVYFLIVLGMLVFRFYSFKWMIVADILGRVASNLFAAFRMKEIVIGEMADWRTTSKELFMNMRIGSKLMVANLSGILIIGIIRFGVERNWGIKTFGQVSLTLSLSNMMMLLVNAVGVIMFPMLRRMNKDKLALTYQTIREVLMAALFACLWGYFPIVFILGRWLPHYAASFDYMILLFPMIVFESKMVLLINSFLKTLRFERAMLLINLAVLALSAGMTFLTAYCLKNLQLSILNITLMVALKAIISEYFLGKQLGMNMGKGILMDSIIAASFILICWRLPFSLAAIAYLAVYILYIVLKYSKLKTALAYMLKS